MRDPSVWTPSDDAAFRWLTRRYEVVSRDRVKVGQELTAIFEGRDPAWGDTFRSTVPVERLLADIRHGRRDAPAPVAGIYHTLSVTERGLRDEVTAYLIRHPVGPWLGRLHGVGSMLAAQLLTRLDRGRAPRPSSFWAFCGLATMPAVEAECDTCGARIELPVGTEPPRDHVDARDGSRRCQAAVRVAEASPCEGGRRLRVATSRSVTSKQPRFDQSARVTCHLIGVTMLRTNGTYAPVYHEARARFQREREGWSGGRVHLSALRVMEKRFLLDLWHAWPEPATGRGRAPRGDVTAESRRPAAIA
ncbi:MAG TPA: hypothetical protein VG916_13865 [Gemmatimonadaceae bacterium]|nr:hypothetical protein [Gemmatimonadaceae bacterium]